MKQKLLGCVLMAVGLFVAGSGQTRDGATEPEDDQGRLFAEANNAFAAALYQRLATTDGNVFFSPYSVSAVFAMAAEGARGETASEMGRVLAYPERMRTVGAEAAATPWRMAALHADLAALSRRLAEDGNAATADERQEIARLNDRLVAVQARIRELMSGHFEQALKLASAEERPILDRLNALLEMTDHYELRTFNALFGERTYPFSRAFTGAIDRYYSTGGIIPCDFINDYPAERVKINRWVEKATEERIRNMMPDLSPQEAGLLRLVLVNAVYFQGEWVKPFPASRTAPASFRLAGGGTVQVNMMNALSNDGTRYAAFNADGTHFPTPGQMMWNEPAICYPDTSGFTMVELPYKDGNLAMLVIVPRTPSGLAEIERHLAAGIPVAWSERLEVREVMIALPRFQLEADYGLEEELQAMGMALPFSSGADFSAMTDPTTAVGGLFISSVRQKSFIKVNERGTEAAAATVGDMLLDAEMTFVPEFRADRPFLFLIRDRVSGCILFMGRVMQPSEV